MENIEVLDNCTLLQACEWIAFQRPPMTHTQEKATNFIRPEPPIMDIPVFNIYSPKPTYPWEKYFQALTVSCAKLKLALMAKQLQVFGINSQLSKISQKKHPIDVSDEDNLNWRDNTISSTFFTFQNISINFAELKKIFPGPNTWEKTVILKLILEDDNCVYLYTGNIQKTRVKKFAKEDNKTQRVIKYIMQHPNKLITRKDLINANIKGFDTVDRIDTIIKNAFSNLNIYKYFFKNPRSSTIEFIPQITNLDIDSTQFDKIIIK